VIAVQMHRSWLPTPVTRPWLAIGPMCEGRGEWQRTVGAAVSIGRTTWTLRWQVDVDAVRMAVLRLLVSPLAARVGRRS
jgi:hypothetical protein